MLESHQAISLLLVALCVLAALDLWRQVALKSEAFWLDHYTRAVRSRDTMWRMGYRVEDLEVKLEHQNEELQDLLVTIDRSLAPKFRMSNLALRHNVGNIEFTRSARIATHNMYRNDTSVHYISCRPGGPRLRVGVNDYRTDPRDECQVFADVVSDQDQAKPTVGPQAMFELVPYKDGAFGLRSVASGQFLRAVAPPSDHPSLPWKLMVGGAVVGAGEIFRLSDEGFLYSSLMGGFLSCSAGQPVTGSPSDEYTSASSLVPFFLESVPAEEMHRASMLVDLSIQIMRIQGQQLPARGALTQRQSSSADPAKVALCVPMTSKGTEMSSTDQSPFWANLFDSFMKSVDWRSSRIMFKFYLGFDRADALYDTGDAWTELREEFKNRAIFRMTEQMMTEQDVAEVLRDRLHLKIQHFDHLNGAPSQVVSQLVLMAHADGFDYFYQINDDSVIASPNWAPKLIETLRSNPLLPNLGVTGPSDSNNEKIFTHSFTHRTHVEIFGCLFPSYFKNWWSDDWISTVYGAQHTFRTSDVIVQHNIRAQKTGATQRYDVDRSAQFHLGEELRKGHVLIDRHLRAMSLPRLPLPSVCGYIPSARYIAHHVIRKSEHDLAHAF